MYNMVRQGTDHYFHGGREGRRERERERDGGREEGREEGRERGVIFSVRFNPLLLDYYHREGGTSANLEISERNLVL